MSVENVPFGDWLWQQIDRHGWSVSDFAARAGVVPSSVSRWVNNRRIPDPASCMVIAEALGMDVDVVLAKAGHRAEERQEIDLSDPLVSFAAMNQHKLTPRQKQAMIDFIRGMIEEGEEE